VASKRFDAGNPELAGQLAALARDAQIRLGGARSQCAACATPFAPMRRKRSAPKDGAPPEHWRCLGSRRWRPAGGSNMSACGTIAGSRHIGCNWYEQIMIPMLGARARALLNGARISTSC
jgi:hypothetical protein